PRPCRHRAGRARDLSRDPSRRVATEFIMTLSITLIGGPTALIEIDGFRLLTDPAKDLRLAFDALGFGKRLKLLEPGAATVIYCPHPEERACARLKRMGHRGLMV